MLTLGSNDGLQLLLPLLVRISVGSSARDLLCLLDRRRFDLGAVHGPAELGGWFGGCVVRRSGMTRGRPVIGSLGAWQGKKTSEASNSNARVEDAGGCRVDDEERSAGYRATEGD